MKRKLTAFVLAAMMAFSAFSVPSFARYSAENSTYTYIQSTDLVASIDDGNGNIVLTWPACDTQGNIIKDNPLKAEGQINSTGNPVAGWTNPTNGMVIKFAGWAPEGTNKTQHSISTELEVVKGVVDTPTAYPVRIYDAADATKLVKEAYVDDTVVATSIATAYKIEYSKDGQKWTLDHTASTIDHGKKLTHVINGEEKTDAGNTFFLEDQITEAIAASLEPSTKYYIRVTATDASSTSKSFKVYETEITTPAKAEYTPAFPTVEGGGMFSQGGRGTESRQGDVYVVTNLTDSVSDPQPGSLRYGLERRDRADGNKTYPRTIVFAVGGTIHIDPTVGKAQRRFNVNSNTTIAGQSAPGTGITIAGASMKFEGTNIIVRYTKFRLGSGYDLDGATASGKNIVVDHCTFSYGVDETFSGKELVNSSIQYNIIDSGLSIPDKDGKNNDKDSIGADTAKHGMGSIFNGYETSFTHNLWSNTGTRNPRFEGGFLYNNVRYENKLDFANNVVYNWGHGSSYGGSRGNGLVNFENNFFRPGPNTLEKVSTQFYECYQESGYNNAKSSYYINGNVMDGSADVTADNTKGFRNLGTVGLKLDSKVALDIPYTLETAEEAYNKVIDGVGASLHRDAWDNRLLQQVVNNTGYFVNSADEAGGFDTAEYAQTIVDKDNDGLPADWEENFNLSDSDPTDSTKIITTEGQFKGYTYLEVYLNDLAGDWDASAAKGLRRDAVHITSLKDSAGNDVDTAVNADLKIGETYTLICDDTANDFEVYLNNRKLADGKNGTASFTPDKEGSANLMVLSKNGSGDNIWSDAVRTTTVNMDETLLLGDVDLNGKVEAADSAVVLQYVLNRNALKLSSKALANAQIKNGNIDASFAAEILQKALRSTYKFENEGSSTGENLLAGFSAVEVGNTRAKGADFYNAATNTLVTEGNGFYGRTGSNGGTTEESLHYNCKQISGDVTMTAKVYNWAKIDYYQFAGIMLRGDLTNTAENYGVGMTYLKDEDSAGPGINGGRFEGRNMIAVYRDVAGEFNSNFMQANSKYLGVPQAVEGADPIGGWAKVVKEGQTVTLYSSLDGENWYRIAQKTANLPDNYYIGFATSSSQDTMNYITYNKALVTDIDIQYSAVYPNQVN
ncbi:MAG: hypothetical protein J6A07_03455 [Firmicutes bacterium]|nr:hypothetical protein [Bacillota bacterium]